MKKIAKVRWIATYCFPQEKGQTRYSTLEITAASENEARANFTAEYLKYRGPIISNMLTTRKPKNSDIPVLMSIKRA